MPLVNTSNTKYSYVIGDCRNISADDRGIHAVCHAAQEDKAAHGHDRNDSLLKGLNNIVQDKSNCEEAYSRDKARVKKVYRHDLDG